jgi:hypothetical protein
MERFTAHVPSALSSAGHILEERRGLPEQPGPKCGVVLGDSGKGVRAEAAHCRAELAIGDSLDYQRRLGLEVGTA